MTIPPNRHIAALEPYALADGSVPSGRRPILLAQNELALPPTPAALAAARAALESAHLYPDPDWSDLRAAIGAVHGIEAEAILCGAGSMELILATALGYLGPETRALVPQYGYQFLRTAARIAGATVDLAPERNLTVDVDALIAAVRPETRIVFLANPANPTGTHLPRPEMVRLREALPDHLLLVIDEAYGEFVGDDAVGPLFDMTARGGTVVLRTFSKVYGLAGLRVGWGCFPRDVAQTVRRVLAPNNVAAPALAAAAAAMRDQDAMAAARASVVERRDRFAADLRRLGFAVPPSQTNFVLIGFSGETAAAAADRHLRNAGIVLRGVGGYGLANCLRATIGGEDDMALVVSVLTDWLASATP